MSDAFDNYVVDPMKGEVIDNVADATGLGSAVDAYNNVSNDASHTLGTLTRTARFFQQNFF